MRKELEDLALNLGCPYCGEQPGDPCRTGGGRFTSYIHSSRSYEVWQAWGIGYQEAENDSLQYVRGLSTEQILNWHTRVLAGKRW